MATFWFLIKSCLNILYVSMQRLETDFFFLPWISMKQLSVNLFLGSLTKSCHLCRVLALTHKLIWGVLGFCVLPVCVFDFEDEDGLEATKWETESAERENTITLSAFDTFHRHILKKDRSRFYLPVWCLTKLTILTILMKMWRMWQQIVEVGSVAVSGLQLQLRAPIIRF